MSTYNPKPPPQRPSAPTPEQKRIEELENKSLDPPGLITDADKVKYMSLIKNGVLDDDNFIFDI